MGIAQVSVDSQDEVDDYREFDRNKTSYSKLPFKTLARGLRRSNKQLFSWANIKAHLEKRGAKEKSLEEMLNMIEYLSDIEKEEHIDPDKRTKAAIIVHIDRMIAKYPERMQYVTFPMDYTQKCPWIIDHAKPTVAVVTNRFTEKSIEVTVPKGSQLYVAIAYSWASRFARSCDHSTAPSTRAKGRRSPPLVMQRLNVAVRRLLEMWRKLERAVIRLSYGRLASNRKKSLGC